jgi:ribonuclease HI
MTNNVAECVALTELLGCILEEFPQAAEVWIKGDSNIIIRQMNKIYPKGKSSKSPAGHYAKYLPAAKGRANVLRARCLVSFDWIPRENNSVADALADFRGF